MGVSQLALLFNVCLIAGGLLMAVFMLGLGLYIGTKLSCVAAAVGVFCALSCSLVGVFPMNNLSTHVLVAYSFSYSALVTITLFTIVAIRDKQKKLPKWLVVFGIMGAISVADFLAVPHLTRLTHATPQSPRHSPGGFRALRGHRSCRIKCTTWSNRARLPFVS